MSNEQRIRQLWAHFSVDKYGGCEPAEDAEEWFYTGALSMWIAIFEILEDASDEDKVRLHRAVKATTDHLMTEVMAYFGYKPPKYH